MAHPLGSRMGPRKSVAIHVSSHLMLRCGHLIQRLAVHAAANEEPDKQGLSGSDGTCHNGRRTALFGQSGLQRDAGNDGVLIRVVGVRDVLLEHAMGVEE